MNLRTVSELLQHERFLAALARSLLRENGRGDRHAEDAVQDTWIVALRRLESHGTAPRPWLAAVLRNIVRRKLRDDVRRSRREQRVARPDTVDAADEAVMSRRLKGKLARLVQGLPEKYREPILLRFFDGMTPQQIAQRLAMPASTVRTHVQRGLEKIRCGLVENQNGDAHAAVALLVPLTRRSVRRRLVFAAVAAGLALVSLVTLGPAARTFGLAPNTATERAARSAARAGANPTATDGSGRTAISRAAVLRGRVEAPPGVVRLTVRDAARRAIACDFAPGAPFTVPVGGMILPLSVTASHADTEPRSLRLTHLYPIMLRLHRRPSASALSAGLDTSGNAPGSRGGGRAGKAGPEALLAAGDSAAESPAPWLEGVVRLPPGVAGEATLRVAAALHASVRDRQPFRVPLTRLFEQPDSRPERVVVTIEHPSTLSETVTLSVNQDGETGALFVPRLEVDLIAAREVNGRVTRADGGVRADLVVLVYRGDDAGPLGAPRSRARTDDEGRFEVRAEDDGRYWAVAFGDVARPGAVSFQLVAGEPAPELDVLLPAGATLSGQVRRSDATPAAAARLVVRREEGAGRRVPVSGDKVLLFGEHGPEWLVRRALTDDEGRYRVDGLGSVGYRVELVSLPETDAEVLRTLAQRRAIVPPGSADFELGAAVVSFQVTCEGRPASGALASLRGLGRAGALELTLDDGGAGRVDVVPGVRYMATITAPGCLSLTEEIEAPVSGTLEVERVLETVPATASLRVRLVPRAAAPVPATALVELRDDRDALVRRATVRAVGGAFLLEDIVPARYRLTIYPGYRWSDVSGEPPVAGLGAYLPARAPVELVADTATELTLPVEAGGRLSLRVVGLGGAESAFTAWVETLGRDRTDLSLAREEGRRADRMRTRNLLSGGIYVLWVAPGDPALTAEARRIVLPAGRTLDLEIALTSR